MKEVNQKVEKFWDEESETDLSRIDRTDEAIHGILDHPQSTFHKTTWKMINSRFHNLTGIKICVPSSGDNHAVFAFSALGAKVTSCDICEKQLMYAKQVAAKFHLDIEFSLQNTMELSGIQSSEYDFVYTSEGVHVWIDDLNAMYRSIFRILKQGGAYINFEIHPFCRPFADELGKIHILKPYELTGPFGDGTTYDWRLQDILNAVASPGLLLKHLEEMHDEKDTGHFWFYKDKRKTMTKEEIEQYYNWKTNPQAALPQWFSILVEK